METKTIKLLKELASKGFKERYGEHPDKLALLRLLFEYRRIDVMGFAELYLMAYWIFKETATAMGINVWPRGAMSSSMVCYSLGLTEVDPVRYGLHSARFVNEEPPKFQFDVEEARFNEFKAKAEEELRANPDTLDYETGCKCLLGDLQPMSYLSRIRESPLPMLDKLDEEIAKYALCFPDTMNLYEEYKERNQGANWNPTGIAKLDEVLSPTNGLLAYQEQMFDIMKNCFNIHGALANKIRLAIQRGKTKNINAYRKELWETAKNMGLSEGEYETVWTVLTSNPKAFLKAHAVSRVVSMYYYEVSFLLSKDKQNMYEYVDLGLSVKWATCNIGASKPEDYGNYYAWGETEPKDKYDLENYKFKIGGGYMDTQFSKYNTKGERGILDNKTTLDLDDDAAHVNWGGSWRMPTTAEQEELLNNCTCNMIKLNGVDGYRLTSNRKGYTDRSIFLPAAGFRYKLDTLGIGVAQYLSSSIDSDKPHISPSLSLRNSVCMIIDRNYRYKGYSVRPVCKSDEWLSHITIKMICDSIKLVKDGCYGLEVNVKYDSEDYSYPNSGFIWASDNPAVAIVNDLGFVRALSNGTANITATLGTLSVHCYVTVINESELVITHEYIDLGLSVKWATCNVGATRPEEYGMHYAWGETQPKSTYTLGNNKYRISGDSFKNVMYSKYNTRNNRGFVDNKTILEPDDDVAHVNWGDSWRMPTREEFEELNNNCKWELTKMNGIYGYLITSNKPGYTDRSIFLPAAGDEPSIMGRMGWYRTSSLYIDDPAYTWVLSFNLYQCHDIHPYCLRCCSLTVRPVHS